MRELSVNFFFSTWNFFFAMMTSWGVPVQNLESFEALLKIKKKIVKYKSTHTPLYHLSYICRE